MNGVGPDLPAPAWRRASKVLFRLLYKNHQPFLEACLAHGRLPVALRYMRLLPPDRRAWSLLLRTAVSAGERPRAEVDGVGGGW